MKVYRCKKRFFCTPLKRYLPVGALIARYENAARIVLSEAPQSDQDVFNVLVDGFVYDDPKTVSWLYSVEPPPLGHDSRYFVVVGSKDEDQFGNVSGTSDGLPSNSKLKIDVSDGTIYLQSVTNGLWYPVRLSGVDGSVAIEVGQIGKALP
jgi:hypothetical protein